MNPWQRLQQNHALEHATLHILAHTAPGLRVYALSDWAGFSVFGELETSALIDAVSAALQALHSGNLTLAQHPRCGTNLALPLGLAGGLVLTALSLPARYHYTRAALMMLAGGVVGARKPLSRKLQQVMTRISDLDGAAIRSVERHTTGSCLMHRVSISY